MRVIKSLKRRKSPKTFPREGLARIPEAARFLNSGVSTVYTMIDDGRLRKVDVGSQMRIPWAVLWAIHDGKPQESVAEHSPNLN